MGEAPEPLGGCQERNTLVLLATAFKAFGWDGLAVGVTVIGVLGKLVPLAVVAVMVKV